MELQPCRKCNHKSYCSLVGILCKNKQFSIGLLDVKTLAQVEVTKAV